MKDIIRSLAVQTFFLFDKNNMALLLPKTEISLSYGGQIRTKVLLKRILEASQEKNLISKKVALWNFTKMIRKDFLKVFEERCDFLEKHGHRTELPFPYPKETFLLDKNFTVTEDMIKKQLPVKPSTEEIVVGIPLTDVIIDHDNSEIWRQFDVGNGSTEDEVATEAEFSGNPV